MAVEIFVRNNIERVGIALLAGFTPIVLKYVSRDPTSELSLLNWSYFWTGLMLAALGLVACYLSGEQTRMKLFAIAIAAPALFSNMTGETTTAEAGTPQALADTSANPIDAVARYLGEEPLYTVSIFASRSFKNADNLAKAINERQPQLEAHVPDKRYDHEFYSVTVGQAFPLDQARLISKRANDLLVDLETDTGPKKGFGLNAVNWIKPYNNGTCRV